MSCVKCVFGKPREMGPVGRPCCRWEENFRIDLTELVNIMNWINSNQDRDYWRVLVSTALNLWIP